MADRGDELGLHPLDPLALGDVVDEHHVALRRPAGLPQHGGVERHPQLLSASAAHLELSREGLSTGHRVADAGLCHAVGVWAMQHVPGSQPDQLVRGIVEHSRERLVAPFDAPIEVGDQHPGVHLRGDGGQAGDGLLIGPSLVLGARGGDELGQGGRERSEVFGELLGEAVRMVGQAEDAHELAAQMQGQAEVAVERWVAAGPSARPRIVSGTVRDHDVAGHHGDAEESLWVVEDQPALVLPLVQKSRLLVPGDVRDGASAQVGAPLRRQVPLGDEPVLAAGKRKDVLQQPLERAALVSGADELGLHLADGAEQGVLGAEGGVLLPAVEYALDPRPEQADEVGLLLRQRAVRQTLAAGEGERAERSASDDQPNADDVLEAVVLQQRMVRDAWILRRKRDDVVSVMERAGLEHPTGHGPPHLESLVRAHPGDHDGPVRPPLGDRAGRQLEVVRGDLESARQ